MKNITTFFKVAKNELTSTSKGIATACKSANCFALRRCKNVEKCTIHNLYLYPLLLFFSLQKR